MKGRAATPYLHVTQRAKGAAADVFVSITCLIKSIPPFDECLFMNLCFNGSLKGVSYDTVLIT